MFIDTKNPGEIPESLPPTWPCIHHRILIVHDNSMKSTSARYSSRAYTLDILQSPRLSSKCVPTMRIAGANENCDKVGLSLAGFPLVYAVQHQIAAGHHMLQVCLKFYQHLEGPAAHVGSVCSQGSSLQPHECRRLILKPARYLYNALIIALESSTPGGREAVCLCLGFRTLPSASQCLFRDVKDVARWIAKL